VEWLCAVRRGFAYDGGCASGGQLHWTGRTITRLAVASADNNRNSAWHELGECVRLECHESRYDFDQFNQRQRFFPAGFSIIPEHLKAL